MYGLVNKAVEQLVVSQFGEERWREIADKANVKQPFISMNAYPDHVTFDLVEAASEVLDTPPEVILEAFGEHWIQYTVDEGYGKLIALYGDSVVEFLQNMDSLHAQIRLSFPELKPPVISCEPQADGQLMVSYQSERTGLAPMLVGLVKGLGKRFSTPVCVKYVESDKNNTGTELFLVSFEQQQAA
ncbi:MAG: heme NO-binding domain-containing protein [Granulosicoccus sp.]